MKLKKFVVTLLASLTICTTTITIATPPLETEAHSGRTDQYGGHRDTKNKSGLGSYHYHCGGYPAHSGRLPFCLPEYLFRLRKSCCY